MSRWFQPLFSGPSRPQDKYTRLENEVERSNQNYIEDTHAQQQVRKAIQIVHAIDDNIAMGFAMHFTSICCFTVNHKCWIGYVKCIKNHCQLR